jgi:acyl-coenzyme A thioesterase PaaI-like protein
VATLSCKDLERLLRRKLPSIDQNEEAVETVSADRVRVRMPFRPQYMGGDVWQDSGERVFSGPKVMGFADTAMYACMHAALGEDVIAVMSNLVITFMRPAKARDLIAEARLIRRGRSLAYLEAYLYSDGSAEPIAHATSSFAYRFPGIAAAERQQ